MLTTLHHLCLEEFLAKRGAAFAPEVVPLPYAVAFGLREFPHGTYIFADLERLSGADLSRAAWLWQQLAMNGHAVQRLNHPTQVKQRFELLRTLHTQGINDFDVYRLDEHRVPVRFPVFVRNERQHNAVASGLLADAGALEEFVQEWRTAGHSVDGTIITEFCSEPDERGLYRRYAAFKVGDRILPTDIFFGRQWEVRGFQHTFVVDEHTLRAEAAFLRDNPHEQQLRAVFAAAQIDYGRVDYGVVGERIQVYEINSNPYIAASPLGGKARALIYEEFTANFLAALSVLNEAGKAGLPSADLRTAIPLRIKRAAQPEKRRTRLWHCIKQLMYTALWHSAPASSYASRLRRIRHTLFWAKRWLPSHAEKT